MAKWLRQQTCDSWDMGSNPNQVVKYVFDKFTQLIKKWVSAELLYLKLTGSLTKRSFLLSLIVIDTCTRISTSLAHMICLLNSQLLFADD